jgi:hypothetical protein
MLAEAVELWLQAASAKEIKRRVKLGGSVQPLVEWLAGSAVPEMSDGG